MKPMKDAVLIARRRQRPCGQSAGYSEVDEKELAQHRMTKSPEQRGAGYTRDERLVLFCIAGIVLVACGLLWLAAPTLEGQEAEERGKIFGFKFRTLGTK